MKEPFGAADFITGCPNRYSHHNDPDAHHLYMPVLPDRQCPIP